MAENYKVAVVNLFMLEEWVEKKTTVRLRF